MKEGIGENLFTKYACSECSGTYISQIQTNQPASEANQLTKSPMSKANQSTKSIGAP